MKSPCSVVAIGGQQVADPHVLGQERPEAGWIAAHVGAAEVTARGVGDHVGAPGRIGDEADAVLRLLRRHEVPPLDEGLSLLDRCALLVDHQRGIKSDRAKTFRRFRDAL